MYQQLAEFNSSELSFRYKDYLAVICLLKDALSVRTTFQNGQPRADTISTKFMETVRHYREEVTNDGQRMGAKNVRLDSYLFNPCCHEAFGYSDYVELVLVDDFDPYFRLTADLSLPVSQIILAFCPDLTSLGIPVKRPVFEKASDTIRWTSSAMEPWLTDRLPKTFDSKVVESVTHQSPFVELHDLLRVLSDEKEDFREIGNSPRVFDLLQHEAPLLVFSRFRLGGLAVLGHGLLQRRAIYRAMARQVVKVQAQLLQALQHDTKDRFLLGAQQLQISESDIQNLSIAFLDTLGPEEIGIYVNCRNYSVALSVITSLASLNYRDMFEPEIGGKHLRPMVKSLRTHSSLIRAIRDGQRRQQAPKVGQDHAMDSGSDTSDIDGRLLEGNHIVSRTYSVLGIIEGAYTQVCRDTDRKCHEVRGVVEVYSRCNVCSGHLATTQQRIRESLGRGASPLYRLNWGQVERFLVGRYDYDFSLSWNENESILAISTSDFLRLARKIQSDMRIAHERTTNDEAPISDPLLLRLSDETGFLDIASGVVVPVPKLMTENCEILSVSQKDHEPLMIGLVEGTRKLFEDTKEATAAHAPLSYGHMERILEILPLPIRLKRTIQHLVKNFRDSLQDPLLFDHVLDLYECFRALHIKITKDLPHTVQEILDQSLAPRRQSGSLKADWHRVLSRSLSLDLVEGLTEYVDAMQNAHGHRLYQESSLEFSEWAVDLRGGLVQLVHGASVPMKCGIGLLNWCWETEFGNRDRRSPTKNWAGMVTRLSLSERRKVTRIYKETDERASLGVMTFSVGHIVNPAEFTQYLHEAAHIIIKEWNDWNSPLSHLLSENNRRSTSTPEEYTGLATQPPKAVLTPSSHDSEQAGRQVTRPREKETHRLVSDQMDFWDYCLDAREELFAILLTQLFFFETDYRTGQRHRVMLFNSSPEASEPNDQAAFKKFLFLMLDSYIAVSALRHFEQEYGAGSYSLSVLTENHPWFNDGIVKDNCFARFPQEDFRGYIEEVGRYYLHFEEFQHWLEDFFKSGSRQDQRWFTREYQARLLMAHDIWWRATNLYRKFVGTYWKDLERRRLDEQFGKAFHDGEASFWRVLADVKIPRCLPELGLFDANERVDELGILISALRAHIQGQMDEIEYSKNNVPIHYWPPLPEHPNGVDGSDDSSWCPDWLARELHQVDGAENEKATIKLLLDRCHSRPRIFDTEVRRKRLKADIAVLRICWDLSTRQRARRLVRLVQDGLSKNASSSISEALAESFRNAVVSTELTVPSPPRAPGILS